MRHKPDKVTEEGFRRLLAFSDAVVAIAMTLLVLPLTDIVGDLHEHSVAQLWHEDLYQLVTFLISFAVIWLQWRSHHRIMEHFRVYDGMIIRLTGLWLLTIVVMPFATALETNNDLVGANVAYLVVLVVAVGVLITMCWWGGYHPDLLAADADADYWRTRPDGFVTFGLLLVALVIAISVPGSDSWPLLLLLLTTPIERGVDAWDARRSRSG